MYTITQQNYKEIISQLQEGLKFPFVNVTEAPLQSSRTPDKDLSIMIDVSLDKREDWKYGYIENSRYARLHVENDNKCTQFSGSGIKIRKTSFKTIEELIQKLNKYVTA